MCNLYWRGATYEGRSHRARQQDRENGVGGPSRQIMLWNLMSAFRAQRTLCEVDTKRIGRE
jgi:hypothetical protein